MFRCAGIEKRSMKRKFVQSEEASISLTLLKKGLQAVQADKLVKNSCQRMGDILLVGKRKYDLNRYNRIVVIGAGKASATMAAALESILGDRITEGVVVVKDGHVCSLKQVTLIEAGHPVPDHRGLLATEKLIEVARKADVDDLVLCLLSGGASALMVDLVAGVSLEALQQLNSILLRSGADINQINTVRKHLSLIKGGQLSQLIFPATLISLIVSDVVGNSLDVIASGPTCPDSSTFEQAFDVLRRFDLIDKVDRGIVERLELGMKGMIQETPVAGSLFFERVLNVVVGDNGIALEAIMKVARKRGFETICLTSTLQGKVSQVATWLVETAYSLQKTLKEPLIVIAGGEVVVEVDENAGVGGRNQHLALTCAMALEGHHGITVLCAGTDGTDGPTNAAGAVVDGQTVTKALSMGLKASNYLDHFNAYTFFNEAGGLVKTGPTGTNVMDVVIMLIQPK